MASLWKRSLAVALPLRAALFGPRGIGPREIQFSFGLWCLFEGARLMYAPAGWLSVGLVLTFQVLRQPRAPIARLDEVLAEVLAALGRRNA